MKKTPDAENAAHPPIDWEFRLKTRYDGDPSNQVFDVIAIHPSGAADEAQVGYYPDFDDIFIGGFENFVSRQAELFGEGAGTGDYGQLFDSLKTWLRAEVLGADNAE